MRISRREFMKYCTIAAGALGLTTTDLLKIDEAIRKLDEGTYGICEDCGDEISEQRLKILPYAIYCIDCKEKREKNGRDAEERRPSLILDIAEKSAC